jgi:hypothetical protein
MLRKKLLYAISTLSLVALPVASAFAQGANFNPNNLRLQIFQGDFWVAFGTIFNFLLIIAGVIAFLFVLYGGFLYLTAGGDAARAENGRKFITNALIGIIIVFVSYALVQFVRGRTTTQNNLNFQTSP